MGSEINVANKIILISTKSNLKAVNTNESGVQYLAQ